MGTLTISAAGFANLPATAPPNWNEDLVYPGGGTVNGSKAYTISDADWQRLLNWAATANGPQLVGTNKPPVTVTGTQVLLSLVQNWVNGMIQAEQQFGTTPPQVPPPITIA